MNNSLPPRVRAMIINCDPTQPDALTISEFCKTQKISRSIFYRICSRASTESASALHPRSRAPHLGAQVLDTEMKRFTHIIRMAAFNTAVTLARQIRTNTGYKRANRQAHNLVRTILVQAGDIDPTVPGLLTMTLDLMPTQRETRDVAELCRSLTETRYPGTDLVLQYAIKERLG